MTPDEYRKYCQLCKHCAAQSIPFYLDHVVINSSPLPRRWGTIRESWQDELLAPKLPAFEYLAGHRKTYSGPTKFFDILARGHDKTSLEGRLASALLMSSRRPIDGFIMAQDKDQGRILKEAMQEEAALNPWVKDTIKFTRDVVTGPGGRVQIVPADAGGAYGGRGNLFIFDEMMNWDKPVAKKVFDAVMSGTAKRDPAIVVIITNEGYFGSWQEGVYLQAAKSPAWATFKREGQLASWMTKEKVDQARASLSSPAEGRRLFDNIRINRGEEQDYISFAEATACCNDLLFYRTRRDPSVQHRYYAAIDYGPTKDRTVCTVGHVDGSGRAIVDRMDVLPSPTKPSDVRNWIREINTAFDPHEWVVDPYQMLGEIEWMRGQRLPVFEWVPRGGSSNYKLAMMLRAMVKSGGVQWYPGCGKIGDGDDTFENELARLVVKRMPYGFRIDHLSSQHDDRAVSLGMMLCRMFDRD